MSSRGMTMIEVMVVVIVIGILAALAFPKYQRAVEKSRSSEARSILGIIRQAQDSYYINEGCYGFFNNLNVNYPSASCNDSYYFRYNIVLAVNNLSYIVTATRCTSGGKWPRGYQAFVLNMTETGVLGGTAEFL